MKATEIKISQLKSNEAVILNRISQLDLRCKAEKELVFEEYFTVSGEYKLNTSADRVSITALDSRYGIIDIYFYENYNDGKYEITKPEISMSSFRSESFENGWVGERYEVILKAIHTVEDYGDDIIGRLNIISNNYRNLKESLWPELKDIRKVIAIEEALLKQIEKDEMMTQLFGDGINISQLESDRYYPSFDVKFDWTVRGVKKLKATRKSASGKSVDLEIEIAEHYGDRKTIVVDRVRFDNVEFFLKHNSERIAS